jgi:cell division protein FtsB
MRASLNPFRSMFGALMFTFMALVIVAGVKNYRDLRVAREREQVLEGRIFAAEERLVDLRERVELLRDDPATLERLAREYHGLVMPDDLVLVLPKPVD